MAPQARIDEIRPEVEAALGGVASLTTALSGMLEARRARLRRKPRALAPETLAFPLWQAALVLGRAFAALAAAHGTPSKGKPSTNSLPPNPPPPRPRRRCCRRARPRARVLSGCWGSWGTTPPT